MDPTLVPWPRRIRIPDFRGKKKNHKSNFAVFLNERRTFIQQHIFPLIFSARSKAVATNKFLKDLFQFFWRNKNLQGTHQVVT